MQRAILVLWLVGAGAWMSSGDAFSAPGKAQPAAGITAPSSTQGGGPKKAAVRHVRNATGGLDPLYEADDLFACRRSDPRTPFPPSVAAGFRHVLHERLGLAVYRGPANRAVANWKAEARSALARSGLEEASVYRSRAGYWLVPTGSLIVRFKRDAAEADVRALLNSLPVSSVEPRRRDSRSFVVHMAKGSDPLSVAEQWTLNPVVAWADADCLRQAVSRFLPNDSFFSQQWDLKNTGQAGGAIGHDMGMEQAWNITRGTNAVTIAILDDGFDLSHPDLAPNAATNGWDFVDNDGDPSPVSTNDNHGTAVAGLAAAAADNGVGIAGVANQCRFLPVRFAGDGTYDDQDLLDAIEYAADRADVLNISYWIDPQPDMLDALRYAVAFGRGGKGCVVCCALGNSGVLRRYTTDLAAAPEVVSVGGTSNHDRRSWFSDYGPAVNVMAPAGGGSLGLVTTDRLGADGYTNGDTTTDFEGTSAASPLAAGVAALIASAHPDWTGLEVRQMLEASCDKIEAQASPYNSWGRNDDYGCGRLNAWAALADPKPAWDSYEPDNTMSSAKTLHDGEMQYRALTAGDTDWVRISITNQSDIRLSVVGTTNVGIALYGSATNFIAGQDTDTDYPIVTCEDDTAGSLPAGTYYARLTNATGAAVSQYGLHLAVLNLKDGYESDDNSSTTRTLAPNVIQWHTLYPTDDVDCVKFSLTGTTHVVIQTLGETGGDTFLVVYRQGILGGYNTVVAYNDDRDAANYNYYSLIDQTLGSGNYLVTIDDSTAFDAGGPLTSYGLLLEKYAADSQEPDNTLAQAKPISSGNRVQHTTYPAGDVDWNKFTLTNASDVRVLTDCIDPSYAGDTKITVYNAATNALASNDDGNNDYFSALFLTNLPAGLYYIKTEGYTNTTTNLIYDLSLDVYEVKSLVVSSAYGGAIPPPGTNGVESGLLFQVFVTNSPVGNGTTQYVCRGWSGTGSVPASGATTNAGPFTITTNSTLTWLWNTNYWLHVDTAGNGSVSTNDAWLALGTNVQVTATAAVYFAFGSWQGQTNGCTISSNIITVVMSAPRTVTAVFAAQLATNNVPKWWLAQYGLTNFDADALRDVDHDGLLTWQEWVAGCDPTNINSVFRFTNFVAAASQGIVVRWSSASNRFYDLSRGTNLIVGTNAFVILPGASNLPATPAVNSYTDTVQGAGPYFYKIGVHP